MFLIKMWQGTTYGGRKNFKTLAIIGRVKDKFKKELPISLQQRNLQFVSVLLGLLL